MNRYRRHQPKLQDTLKDYIVPIIWWIIVLLIIYSIFSSWSENDSAIISENSNPIILSFWSSNTDAQIIYPWNNRQNIWDKASVFKWESVVVREGSVRLEAVDGTKIHLNKIAELKIENDGSYSLYSSDAWIENTKDIKITMKYATVEAVSWSIFSLTQNEAWSTIYMLQGNAKITNIAWVNTLLVAWQKISIPRLQASNKDFDILNEKASIDSFFKSSDWFIENEGHTIVITPPTEDTQSGSLDTGTWASSIWWLVRFDTIRDEMSLQSSTLDISWGFASDTIWAITVNNITIPINTSNKSFSLSNFQLSSTVNDLVVKIYDTNKNILEKKVYTIYTSVVSTQSSNTAWNTPQVSNNPSTGTVWSTTFQIDATKFWFTEPSNTGKFSTSSSEVTIRGFTTAADITRVEINGFNLWSFNGSTWRYHAFERFDTIRDGTNQYRVDYYGKNGALVYTDYYTIVKQSPQSWTQTPAVTNTSENTPPSTSVNSNQESSDTESSSLFSEE